MIPETADAASVTLVVNLERLNIHSALDGFVMNPELKGGWKSLYSLNHCIYSSSAVIHPNLVTHSWSGS